MVAGRLVLVISALNCSSVPGGSPLMISGIERNAYGASGWIVT